MTCTRAVGQRFTLVELILVIVIMGVIGGVVAVFMRSPIDAYFDTARRAGWRTQRTPPVRRMSRDIRKALPNSLRQSLPARCCRQPVHRVHSERTGGRYRNEALSLRGQYRFAICAADSMFNMLGRNADLPLDQQMFNDIVAVVQLRASRASGSYASTQHGRGERSSHPHRSTPMKRN
jgi:MSHA biogenesis protein MshO